MPSFIGGRWFSQISPLWTRARCLEVRIDRADKGLQVIEVLSVDNSTAVPALQDCRKARSSKGSFKEPGTVRWFDAEEVTRFIVCDHGSGEDVFVHVSTLKEALICKCVERAARYRACHRGTAWTTGEMDPARLEHPDVRIQEAQAKGGELSSGERVCLGDDISDGGGASASRPRRVGPGASGWRADCGSWCGRKRAAPCAI